MSLTAQCVLLLLLVGRSASQGQFEEQTRKPENLLEYKNENLGADGYEFYYETDDGTSRQEKGSFVEGIWTVVGKSVWRDPTGKIYIAEYTADDQGYKVRLSQMLVGFPGTTITLRPAFPGPPSNAYAGRPMLNSLASLAEAKGTLTRSKGKMKNIRIIEH